MTIRERFLKLTEYTTPFGKESELLPLLPQGLMKDDIGNYFIKIGTTTTMFTCHLDNATKRKEKVKHIIKDNFVKTDKTTILGGDNKAGVCVLSYMIEHNVPGLYYFFIGEEPTAPNGGLYGSKKALARYSNSFKKYKKCIAFDRKEYGSIINRQNATKCCSNEFVNSLVDEFKKVGLDFKVDSTGYYTDTAVFMNIIPECTNLSIGGFHEHTRKESQDMDYLEKVAEAATKINWETLEVKREFNTVKFNNRKINVSTISKFEYFKKVRDGVYKKLFEKVCSLLDSYSCMNKDNFQPGMEMIFSEWFKDTDSLTIVVDYNEDIWINDKKIGEFEVFKDYFIKTFNYNVLGELETEDLYNEIIYFYKKSYDDAKHFDEEGDRFKLTFDEFEKVLEEIGYELIDFIKYFHSYDNDKKFDFIEIDYKNDMIYIYDDK
jgi:hypothetical protein